MGKYQEAIADFESARASDPKTKNVDKKKKPAKMPVLLERISHLMERTI